MRTLPASHLDQSFLTTEPQQCGHNESISLPPGCHNKWIGEVELFLNWGTRLPDNQHTGAHTQVFSLCFIPHSHHHEIVLMDLHLRKHLYPQIMIANKSTDKTASPSASIYKRTGHVINVRKRYYSTFTGQWRLMTSRGLHTLKRIKMQWKNHTNNILCPLMWKKKGGGWTERQIENTWPA